MARRKRFLDDDSSDSSDNQDEVSDPNEDPDARSERLLHQDPYQRSKRRRKGRGKDSATYGVFGDDSEDEDPRNTRRADIAKAPSFVSGNPTKLKPDDIDTIPEVTSANIGSSDEEDEEDEEENEGFGAVVGSDSDSSDPIRPASPRLHAQELSEEPITKPIGLGGGGQAAFRAMFSQGDKDTAPTGTGMRGGIGSNAGIGARAGIGTSSPTTDAVLENSDEHIRPQRSFVRSEESKPAPKPELTAQEHQHFAKISSTFGARMLQKMGWEAGTGLGATREGIVTPIESKLRQHKAGIAFGGFSERTEQSRREDKRKARREGKVVSSDSDEPGKHKHKKKKRSKIPGATFGDEEEQKSAWKRPKKSKVRVEHKTYEEIVQDAGMDATSAGIGQIIDATGAVPREVDSITDISGWAPSSEPTRLVEIRHNIRMIVDLAKGDLDGLAREARALNERKRWVENEEKRLRTKVNDEADLIARLQRVHLVVDEISAKAKAVARETEPATKLEQFTPYFDQLLMEYSGEYERYRLDEIVVASVAPMIRRAMAQWEPLEDPAAFTDIFRRWKKAFRLRPSVESGVLITQGSRPAPNTVAIESQMTPYESLLWSIWLPRVRSSINNDWIPTEPNGALSLFDAWRDLLPAFVHDNVLDQLIIPKIQKAVAEWTSKNSQSLQAIVFPWLPHVGLRMEDLVGDAKRKVRGSLRIWKVGDGVPTDLIAWKDIFGTKDWDNLLFKHVIPKLGATLREDFSVNPRAQDMTPLRAILDWTGIVRMSVLARLIEAEFFQKWLNVLHVWLVSPRPNFDEIAQWYQFWKGVFPKDLLEHPSVANGFERGLQLMNSAMALGPNAPARLPRPDLSKDPLTSSTSISKNTGPGKGRMQQSHAADVSFRTIVDDFAATHNLLLMPTQRTHERSRMPLYRVSGDANGKGGILVYLLDDVVWTGEGEDWKPISLEEMVLKATKKL